MIIGAGVSLGLAPHEAKTMGCSSRPQLTDDLEIASLIFLFISVVVNALSDERSKELSILCFFVSLLSGLHSCPEACHTIAWTGRGICKIICTGGSIAHAVCEVAYWAYCKNA